MKIGAVGLGNRIAHVYHELTKVNNEADLIAYVDPLPIGKEYAEKNNFFPSKKYSTLKEMLSNEKLDLDYSFDVYVNKSDKEKFNWAIITKTITADHTWKEKIRYIFSNEKVKERCGCWSSFSFEKKVPKIDLSKLKEMKNKFKK